MCSDAGAILLSERSLRLRLLDERNTNFVPRFGIMSIDSDVLRVCPNGRSSGIATRSIPFSDDVRDCPASDLDIRIVPCIPPQANLIMGSLFPR